MIWATTENSPERDAMTHGIFFLGHPIPMRVLLALHTLAPRVYRGPCSGLCDALRTLTCRRVSIVADFIRWWGMGIVV